MDTLYDLSLKIVAERMKQGTLGTVPFKLIHKISNDIYQIVSKQNWFKLPEEFCNEASKWLTPTSISITQGEFSEKERNMFSSMDNLVHLWTEGLSSAFRLMEIKTSDGHEIKLQLHYLDILEQILSESSRQSLRSLKFKKEGVMSIPQWPWKMGKLFPYLESLSVPYETFGTNTFHEICCSFFYLKSLDVTGTSIQNLANISNLINLQHLCLSDIRIPAKEALMELFELKKLRSLDVHCNLSNVYSLAIDFFLDCGKVLPNLAILDCSSNVLSAERLSQLLASHPTLRQVDITDTRATSVKDTHPEIIERFPHVKLFTSESLKSCLEYLENQNRVEKQRQTCAVLHQMGVIVESGIYSDQDLRETFQKLVQIMGQWLNGDRVMAAAGRCVITICSLPKFTDFFTFAEKQSLIRTLFKLRNAPENMGSLDTIISQILNIDAILKTSPDNIDSICDYAIELMRTNERARNHWCFEILTKSIEKMKPERREQAEEDFERAAIETLNGGGFVHEIEECLQVFRYFLFLSGKEEIDKEVIEFLLKFCNRLFKPAAQIGALDKMRSMVNGLDDNIRKNFFGERYFSIIASGLGDRAFPYTQKATIALLVELYAYAKSEMAKTFLASMVHKFVIHFNGDLDGLNIFKAIVSHDKNFACIEFAKWILNHFPEEPEVKKRKKI